MPDAPFTAPLIPVTPTELNFEDFDHEPGTVHEKVLRRLEEAEALVRLAAEILDNWGGMTTREDQASAARLDRVANELAEERCGLSQRRDHRV